MRIAVELEPDQWLDVIAMIGIANGVVWVETDNAREILQAICRSLNAASQDMSDHSPTKG